jgi:pSer/pThr/pTyr-binding forkhead associated (FHA) protein
MGSARVRLLLQGELIREVPILDAPLRIGRMKENDLVVNNLSVSRFHATLARDGEGFRLTDLGSENGCWVNGRRVNDGRVGPGDRILVGKHQIEIVVEEAEAPAAPAPRERSDAWDAAATYLVGAETHAKQLAADSEAAAQPSGAEVPLHSAADAAPEAEPAPPFGEESGSLFDDAPSQGAAPDLAEFDVSELDLQGPEQPTAVREAPLGAAVLEAEEDGTEIVDLGAPEAPPEEDAPPALGSAPVHAGLIVQRGGRLERAVPWEADRLTMGRATECEVLLATPEVSRRHAMLVRDGERFEVRDLESINGTFVNGEKVTRRTLKVGDVIRIEDFEITFVLDSAPVDEALKSEPRVAAPAGTRDPGLTQIGDMMDLAPFVAEGEAEPAEAMSFDSLPPVEALPEIEAPGSAELGLPVEADTVLLGDEEPDEEKDLVEAPREARVLRLELRLRVEELPPALREALLGLDPADLRLPVELRLATEEGSG